MKFEKWCELAQDDQFAIHPCGHQYSNFRYCLEVDRARTQLQIDEFRKGLKYARAERARRAAGGEAARLVRKAADIYGTRPNVPSPNEDFRLMSEPINTTNEPPIYFRLKKEGVTVKAGAYGFPPRRKSNRPVAGRRTIDPRIVWLAHHDDLIAATKHRRPSSHDRLITEVADVLGLTHPKPATATWTLTVMRPRVDGALFRPHAFSGGTGDRFCAYSNRPPFGMTIRSTSGDFGVRECVCRMVDIEDITSTPIGQAAIGLLCRACGLNVPEGPLSTQIHRLDLEPTDGYPHLLKRLQARFQELPDLKCDDSCHNTVCECDRLARPSPTLGARS